MPRARLLSRRFYDRPTLEVTEALLGKVLVHESREGTTSGIIVEVEAYIGEEDPACHAAPGPTRRNAPLYGPPGMAYVYFNYGMHYLVNAVTEAEGRPAAVLLRALEPFEGRDVMRVRRAGRTHVRDEALCRGPGNLTCALGITREENGLDLCASRLRIEDRGIEIGTVAWSPRIGIRVGTEQWWRAFVRDHPAVSGPRALGAKSSSEPKTFPWPHAGRAPRVRGGT